MPETLSESELIDAVRELARGPVRERAADADRDGALSQDTFNDLRELGIPGLLAGEAFGGRFGPDGAAGATYLRVIEELAYGDASAAVAVNMHLLVAGVLGLLPPFPRRDAVLRAVAEEGAWICAPGSIPSRELDNQTTGFTAVEDGADLVFSGRAGFASASDAARFALVGAQIVHEGGREPDVVIAFPDIDSPGVANQGNWDGMGLRATASHDIVLDELRLSRSDCFVVPRSLLRMGDQMLPQLQWQRRAWPALGICAIWLGNAQALFDETIAYLRQRRGYLAVPDPALAGSTETRSQQAWAQIALGEMDHWLGTGQIVLSDAARQVGVAYPDRQSFIRMQVRATYHLRRMAEEVAHTSIKTTGAHAYVRGHVLERLYRDLVGGVVMAWKTDELLHSLGLASLGEEITIVGPAGT